jgi:hypothetical protein
MNRLFGSFRSLFNKIGPHEDLINMYLVFMGVRSACLIGHVELFQLIPREANLEIHYKRYPGFSKKGHDYPLVCLKNSWVSRFIARHDLEFTDQEIGIYLGFNCFDQEWGNLKINRYLIRYSLENVHFYNEVCSIQPDISMIARIKFKAKEMTSALRIINKSYNVKYTMEFIPGSLSKKKTKKSRRKSNTGS